GLLHLREFQSFFVFATRGVQCVLQQENRIFRVLERSNPPVKWQMLSSKGRLGCHMSEDSSGPADFICATVPLGGCYPDYVSEEMLRAVPPEEASIGFVIEQSEKRSEEHTSELQSPYDLVCRLLLEKKKHNHQAR